MPLLSAVPGVEITYQIQKIPTTSFKLVVGICLIPESHYGMGAWEQDQAVALDELFTRQSVPHLVYKHSAAKPSPFG